EGLEKDYFCSILADRKKNKVHSIGLLGFCVNTFCKLCFMPRPGSIIGVGLSSAGAMLYGRLFGIKTIYNLSDTNATLRSGIKGLLGVFFTRILENSALKLAEVITVPSIYSKQQLILQYPFVAQKVHVIPEAPLPVKIARKQKTNLILFPWATERKNANLFIQSIPAILQKTNARILLPVDLSLLTEKQRAILTMYKSRVTLSKETTPAEARKRFAIADILVYIPPKEAHSYHVLEAFDSGLPILVSPVGWLKEEFGAYSLMLAEITTRELVEKLQYYFANKKKCIAEYNAKRIKILSCYNYKNMIAEYQSLVKN
ncbi:MAG: glycosyltransferase, partial [Candidatus Woesearchaeota archaeon]|nr:glycosyltransferase [Candidatus Woesearchaeota archaeon]